MYGPRSIGTAKMAAARSPRGRKEQKEAPSLLLPDLGQLKPFLRFERDGFFAGKKSLCEELERYEEEEREGTRRKSRHGKALESTLPPPLVKGKAVQQMLAGVPMLNPGAREFIVDMITRYEARIEALEEEVRIGCVKDLQASLTADAIERQADLTKRQYGAIMSLQKKALIQETPAGAKNRLEQERKQLQEKLEEKTQQCEQLETSLYMTQKETEDLRARLELRNKDVKELRQRIVELTEEVAEAEAVAMQIEERRKALEQELAEQRALAKEAEDRAARQIHDLQESVEMLQDNIEKLNKAHKSELERQDALHEKAMMAVKMVAEEERKQIEAECNQLRAEISLANAARERAEKVAAEAEARAAQMDSFKESVEAHLGIVETLVSNTPAAAFCVPPNQADAIFTSPNLAPDKPVICTTPKGSERGGGGRRRKKKRFPDLESNCSEPVDDLGMSGLSEAVQTIQRDRRSLAMAGTNGTRRQVEHVVRRLGGEAKGVEKLVQVIQEQDSMITMLNDQFDELRDEFEQKQAEIVGFYNEAKAEIGRMEQKLQEAEGQINELLKRLEELEGSDSPLVKELRARQLAEKKSKEAQKKLHILPDLPEGFRQFLERTDKSRRRIAEKVERQREARNEERTKQETVALATEAGGVGSSAIGPTKDEDGESVPMPGADLRVSFGGKYNGGWRMAYGGLRLAMQSGGSNILKPAAEQSPLEVKQSIATFLREVSIHKDTQLVVDTALGAVALSTSMAPVDIGKPVDNWLKQNAPHARAAGDSPTVVFKGQNGPQGKTLTTTSAATIASQRTAQSADTRRVSISNTTSSPGNDEATTDALVAMVKRNTAKAQGAKGGKAGNQMGDFVSTLIGPPVSTNSVARRKLSRTNLRK